MTHVNLSAGRPTIFLTIVSAPDAGSYGPVKPREGYTCLVSTVPRNRPSRVANPRTFRDMSIVELHQNGDAVYISLSAVCGVGPHHVYSPSDPAHERPSVRRGSKLILTTGAYIPVDEDVDTILNILKSRYKADVVHLGFRKKANNKSSKIARAPESNAEVRVSDESGAGVDKAKVEALMSVAKTLTRYQLKKRMSGWTDEEKMYAIGIVRESEKMAKSTRGE